MADFFELRKSGTTVQTEVLAGVSSFLATSYIMVVNPGFLSQAGLPFSGVLTATGIVCFFSSLMMGLYARNLRYAIAAGKGQQISPALLIIDAFCMLALVL